MPTIIDALVVTFGLDGNPFVAEAEKIKRKTKELTDAERKEVEKLEKQAKQALGAIGSVRQGILGLMTAVAGATGLTDFITQVVQAEAALGRLSVHTGQSTQDLQKWGNIAALAGGKAEEMQAGMAGLAKQMVDLKYKGDMSPTLIFFNQMGVALADSNGQMKSQNDLMLEMADRAKGMKKDEFYNLASSAGLNDSQIDTIMKGRTELEKMLKAQEKNALITKEQAESSRKLKAEWEATKQSMFSLGVRILSDVAPAIEFLLGLIHKLFDFLQQHRAIAYAVFGAMAAATLPAILAMGKYIAMLFRALPALRMMVSVAGLATNVFRALAVSMLSALAPILPIVAAIAAVAAAIYLLWDDYKTWKNGGDSLIPWESWSDEIDLAVEDIQRLIQSLGKLGGAVDAIKNGDFAGAWQIIQSTVADTFRENAPKPVQNAYDKSVDWTSHRIEDGANAVQAVSPAQIKGALQGAKAVVDAAAGLGIAAAKGKMAMNGGGNSSISEFADAISSGEGDYNSVNRGLVKGKNLGATTANLSDMTINEVLARNKLKPGDPNRMNAVGKYQIIASTMKGLVKQLGLSGKEKLTPEMQDKLFEALIPQSAKNYMSGKSDDKNAAMLGLSQVWASIGVPVATRGQNRHVKAGESFYAGDGGNKASKKSTQKVSNVLDSIRSRGGLQGSNLNSIPVGARDQMAIGSNMTSSSSSHVETSIGEVNIYTAATDVQGIAGSIGSALENTFGFNTYSVDSGLS